MFHLLKIGVRLRGGFFVSFLQFIEKALLLRRSKAFIQFEMLKWLFFALLCVRAVNMILTDNCLYFNKLL